MLNGTAAPEEGGGGGAEKREEALEAGGGGGGGAESVESERVVESKSSDDASGALVVATLGLFAQGALKVFEEDMSILQKEGRGKRRGQEVSVLVDCFS